MALPGNGSSKGLLSGHAGICPAALGSGPGRPADEKFAQCVVNQSGGGRIRIGTRKRNSHLTASLKPQLAISYTLVCAQGEIDIIIWSFLSIFFFLLTLCKRLACLLLLASCHEGLQLARLLDCGSEVFIACLGDKNVVLNAVAMLACCFMINHIM